MHGLDLGSELPSYAKIYGTDLALPLLVAPMEDYVLGRQPRVCQRRVDRVYYTAIYHYGPFPAIQMNMTTRQPRADIDTLYFLGRDTIPRFSIYIQE